MMTDTGMTLRCVAGKILDFSNADVAVDQYHRFEVSNAATVGALLAYLFMSH